MDIVALESFVTVYNYKNFTKAADKLYTLVNAKLPSSPR